MAASSMSPSDTISHTNGWRVSVVFIVFLIIGAVFQYSLEHVDLTLKNHGLRGLRHTFQKLREELLTLGFISLILAATGDALSKSRLASAHVIHQTHIFFFTLAFSHILFASTALGLTIMRMRGWKKWEMASHALRVEALHRTSSRLSFSVAAEVDAAPTGGTTSTDNAETSAAQAPTKDNDQPQRRPTSIFKGRKWKTPSVFEPRELTSEERTKLYLAAQRRADFLKSRLGRVYLGLIMLFQESVTEPVYLGLRRLFVARMDVHDSFDVLSFVLESMEEEFSEVVGLSGPMWLLVALWLVVPIEYNFPLIISSSCLVLVIIVSVKLETAAQKLMRLSFACFTDHKSITASALARLQSSYQDLSNLDSGAVEEEAQRVQDEIADQADIDSIFKAVHCESGCLSLTKGRRESKGSSGDSKAQMQQQPLETIVETEPSSEGIGTGRAASASVERQKNALWMLDGGKKIDAANLFWFGKPRLLLTILNFTIFESSLSIAFLVFAYWQDEGLIDSLGGSSANRLIAVIVLICIDFFMLVHTAVYVMPVYALVSSLGSHCPDSVMLHASVATRQKKGSARLDPSLKRKSSFAQMSDVMKKLNDTVRRRSSSKNINLSEKADAPPRSSTDEDELPRLSTRDLGMYTAEALGRNSNDSIESETPDYEYENENTSSLTSLLGAMMKKRLETERAAVEQANHAKALEDEREKRQEEERTRRHSNEGSRRRSLRDLFTADDDSAPATPSAPAVPSTSSPPDDVERGGTRESESAPAVAVTVDAPVATELAPPPADSTVPRGVSSDDVLVSVDVPVEGDGGVETNGGTTTTTTTTTAAAAP